ncbi:ABC transporter substrate-binding protein [Nonomuraea endophytica]|uniref:ABC transporter substrate-binding protein n=1 Tax=Nonomuraea endophytica TaxID=714136 RepID=UPI0037C52CD4
MRFSRVSLLAGLVAALALAGCGSGTGGAEPGKTAAVQESSVVNAMALPFLDQAGLHVGLDKGVFTTEGVELTAQFFTDSKAGSVAFNSGEVDLGFANYVSLLQIIDNGAKLKIISEGSVGKPGVQAVMVPESSPIKTVKDLEGKKVAVAVLKNVQPLMLNAVLRDAGADPAKVEYVQVPVPNTVAAVEAGQVDAAAFTEPFTSLAAGKGFRLVTDLASGTTQNWPTAGYFVKQEWIDAHPKTAAALATALGKAQSLAADRASVEKVLQLPTYTKMDATTAAAIKLVDFPTAPDAARLQRVIDQMKVEGLLKGTFKAAELIYTPGG